MTKSRTFDARAWRLSRGWSQKTVAGKLGRTQSAVAQHEKAGVKGLDLLDKYAAIYKTDIAGLLAGPKAPRATEGKS